MLLCVSCCIAEQSRAGSCLLQARCAFLLADVFLTAACFWLQAKGAADKAAGAAKDATGSGAGPLQGAAGDAKNALGQLKQVGLALAPSSNLQTWRTACIVQYTSQHPWPAQQRADAGVWHRFYLTSHSCIHVRMQDRNVLSAGYVRVPCSCLILRASDPG